MANKVDSGADFTKEFKNDVVFTSSLTF